MRLCYAHTTTANTHTAVWHTVLPLHRGVAHRSGVEQEGWYMQRGGDEVFFADDRILFVQLVAVTDAVTYEDCPMDIRAVKAVRDASKPIFKRCKNVAAALTFSMSSSPMATSPRI